MPSQNVSLELFGPGNRVLVLEFSEDVLKPSTKFLVTLKKKRRFLGSPMAFLAVSLDFPKCVGVLDH